MSHQFGVFLLVLLPVLQKADSLSDERLVPIGSTTAFMCQPCFNSNSNATWHKNSLEVGDVSSHHNFIYRNRSRPKNEENMPEIGFLIMYNVQKEDEGVYWCSRSNDSKNGTTYRLRVAYVDKIANNTPIEITPTKPILGREFIAKCPHTNSFPPAKISWTVNSLPISHISSDFTTTANGTLRIAHFSYHHFGFFECHVANLAGKTYAQIFIDSRDVIASTTAEPHFLCSGCSTILKNSIMMFFIGVFVTCSGFLIYLAIAIITLRPDRCSTRHRNMTQYGPRREFTYFPGFRKQIAPMPDYLMYDRPRPPSILI